MTLQHPVIFEFRDYKAYIREALDLRRERERGSQARLAEALRCQSAYLSMVLKGSADLSMEQADGVNVFLAHTTKESHFFLLLVQRARAGTPRLKKYFDHQIDAVLVERKDLSQRLDYQGVLSEEQRAVFYSSWHYMAIHMLLTIPGQRTAGAIAAYLRLPLETVHAIIEFLMKTGLAEEDKVAGSGHYKVGVTRLHLPADSPFVPQTHANWRQQAMQSLQRPHAHDFHYSSVVSASHQDIPRLREIMVRCIEEIRAIVRNAPEEDLFCYTMDIFGLQQ